MSTFEPTVVTAAIAQQHLTHVRAALPQLDQLIRAAILGAQTLAGGEGATPAVREEIAARFAPALDLLDGLSVTVGAERVRQAPSWRTQFNTREQIEALVEGKPRLRVVRCGRTTADEYAGAMDLPADGPPRGAA